MPNIWDFSRRFQITTFDVILFATAATFDPFVVEILLAVVNGAKLLIVPDSFRSVPSKLVDAIIKYGVTFIQMTPSQLKILPHNALTEIFAGRSTIRTIILGGEAFPINFIKRYHINDKFISLYNVYGITEVSCWASCHKIDWKETRVEIGQPLLGTKFNISKTGELLIGGSRRCFVNGKLSRAWLPTGDIVELTELGKIYWCDRSDDQLGAPSPNRSAIASLDVELHRKQNYNMTDLFLYVRSNVPELKFEQKGIYNKIMQTINKGLGQKEL
ncbi:unnamed protein product, partial [Onchocerca ochengi]|uniref:AMP-binding domain-containing protein n=1 Tax=Onchocerca ochengi TaxID=42157 RepID=A0A182ERN9_ONCOC